MNIEYMYANIMQGKVRVFTIASLGSPPVKYNSKDIFSVRKFNCSLGAIPRSLLLILKLCTHNLLGYDVNYDSMLTDSLLTVPQIFVAIHRTGNLNEKALM